MFEKEEKKHCAFLQFFLDNPSYFVTIPLLIAILIAVGYGVFTTIQEDIAFNKWYDSLSPEMRAAYNESQVIEYDLVSVTPYIESGSTFVWGTYVTNGTGQMWIPRVANTGGYQAFAFSYKDVDGTVKFVDDFRASEIVVGNQNKYVVDMRNNTEYLILTTETISNLH